MENSNRLKPVFVLSAGRSGSTLLQRYLNSSKDLVIWGEHGGFLRGLSESYYRFSQHQNVQNLLKWGNKNANVLLNKGSLANQDIEWTNNFTLEDWKTTHQDLILHLLTIDIPSSMRWGFKEIRYGEIEMRFLKELFPDSRFIFLVRNPIDTLSSMIAAWFQPENFWEPEGWENSEILQNLRKFISQHCARTIRVGNGIIKFMNDGYLVKFKELTANPNVVLPAICDYLRIDAPSVKKVMSVSSDVRKATNSKAIREIIQNGFSDNHEVQELCKLYETFGYSTISTQS